MKTTPVSTTDIARSVWAVPPLATGSRSGSADLALARHIEAGGVSTFLWGGNANVYGMDLPAFTSMVEGIPDWVDKDSWAIPAVGPATGSLRDHARILKSTRFPAAMPLPWTGPFMAKGLERALKDFTQIAGMPIILYLRQARYMPSDRIGAMMEDGTICAIKYAVEATELASDAWLTELLDHVSPDRIVSGDGELNGIIHMGAFPLSGFTAGAVCIAPRRAMSVLRAMQSGKRAEAEALAAPIARLEGLRRKHGPIPVLHTAVTASGLADMGPIGTPFADLDDQVLAEISSAALGILDAENELSKAA